MSAMSLMLFFQLLTFLIVLILMHQMYQQLRRDARQNPVGDRSRLNADVGELVTELRSAAEQINADMTSRAATLEKLVNEANDALQRLDSVAQRTGAASKRPARPAAPSEREAVALSARRTTTAEVRRPANPTARPAASAWSGPADPKPAIQRPPVTSTTATAANAYRQASGSTAAPADRSDDARDGDREESGTIQTVRRLAAQGLSATDIARATRLGREEVELIMRVSGDNSE
ncbi:MAG: hypothetical protein EPO26_02850 [Chloroflexota bacterium]|nr:MAG: hypothetical protein EPO26_02850 [Chloroflexota bacterium]